ncbi:MAG: alpha-E domain-containing protein [Bacteroidetes bacterium]|nr:alpha-E domain-containing protein [Bacteroidota bacterium]
MLSRIAESMFWMNRYVERAEGMMRMLKINYVTSLDGSENESYNWAPVLKLFTALAPEKIELIKDNTQAALLYMITDKTNSNSVRSIITKARENARGNDISYDLENPFDIPYWKICYYRYRGMDII